jgi:hypothetical protein
MSEHRERLKQAIDNMERTEVCLDIYDRAITAIREECAKELAHWREAAASVGETDGHGMAETIKELRCITQPAKAQEGA